MTRWYPLGTATLRCDAGGEWSSFTGPSRLSLSWPGCVPEGPATPRNVHPHHRDLRPDLVGDGTGYVPPREPTGCVFSP